MLVWAGASNTDWYSYIRTNYNAEYTSESLYSDANWNSAVHDGYFSVEAVAQTPDYSVAIDASARLMKFLRERRCNADDNLR